MPLSAFIEKLLATGALAAAACSVPKTEYLLAVRIVRIAIAAPLMIAATFAELPEDSVDSKKSRNEVEQRRLHPNRESCRRSDDKTSIAAEDPAGAEDGAASNGGGAAACDLPRQKRLPKIAVSG
jgi:hypothetical protein